MSLKDKNIALICPKFYGYENYIVNELREKGANVYLIYENLEWVKVSYRFVYVYLPSRKIKLQEHYYKKELNDIIKSLDYFFVIRGSSLSADIMAWICSSAPKECKFIMYQWDGVKNNHSAVEVASYFDKVSTFDPEDSEKYGWEYRPLFYISQLLKKDSKKDIDILFICALHSNRAKVLKQLKKLVIDRNYKLKTVLHLNRLLYYKYKYLNKKSEVANVDNKDLTFKQLSIKDSYDLYSRSKVVVDYTNVNQSGFTMRTIESLGNDCKLITNNIRIRNADFYNENNIFIYDEDAFEIPEHFLLSPIIPVSKSVYEKYSLKCWIDDLIGDYS